MSGDEKFLNKSSNVYTYLWINHRPYELDEYLLSWSSFGKWTFDDLVYISKTMVLETAKNHFRIMGYLNIKSPPALLGKIPISLILKCTVIFIIFFGNAPLLWFVVFEAKNFAEFAESFSMLGASLQLYGAYAVLVWKKSEILVLMDDLEGIFRKS